MKINYRKNTIPLGRNEKALWQRATADGRDVAEARARVSDAADVMLDRGATHVEVYAPTEAGGFMLDQYESNRRP